MFKKIIVAAAALAALNAHALTAGDLAFTSFNADEDGFSMVALASIAANTTVYFTDNEWGGSAFNAGEGYNKWVSGSTAIAAGSVIRFASVDTTSAIVTVGSATAGAFTREAVSGNTNWGLSASNETLYAYLGTGATAPTAFLAAVTNGSFAVDGPLTSTGLTEGVNAIRLNANATNATPDYGVYTGVRSGLSSFSAYLPLLANPSNWQIDTTNGAYATTVPDTTAFTVTPSVPEPETYSLALASIGVCVALARRRQQR
jgi:hypothetical protein